MTVQEVATMIESIGLPYAYYQFPEGTATPTPFICYFYPNNDDFFADDSNYSRINELYIELYTDEKDFNLENQIEQILMANDFSFVKSEDYIKSEKMHEVLYQMEVIIDG